MKYLSGSVDETSKFFYLLFGNKDQRVVVLHRLLSVYLLCK